MKTFWLQRAALIVLLTLAGCLPPPPDRPADDDDATPEGPTSRLCSTAGSASNGIHTVVACTGPVELAPGISTNGNHTVVTGTLHLIGE